MNHSRLAIWIEAARPRTLPAAIAPVIVGTALAVHAGKPHFGAAALCLVFALLAQIAANFGNDYFDFVKGADTKARVGPRRAVAAGLISPAAMRSATIGTCIAAFAIGLGLLPFGGCPLLIIGLASLVSAIAYTGGPFPLAYHGLGDLFVFVFFGLVAVSATFFVQTGTLSIPSLVASIGVGCLTTNILVVNNYRDADTDREAGKHTLVVRFGRRFARTQFATNHLLALISPVFVAFFLQRSVLVAFLFMLLPACWATLQIRRLSPTRNAQELISLLADCGRYLAIYSVIFSVWILWIR